MRAVAAALANTSRHRDRRARVASAPFPWTPCRLMRPCVGPVPLHRACCHCRDQNQGRGAPRTRPPQPGPQPQAQRGLCEGPSGRSCQPLRAGPHLSGTQGRAHARTHRSAHRCAHMALPHVHTTWTHAHTDAPMCTHTSRRPTRVQTCAHIGPPTHTHTQSHLRRFHYKGSSPDLPVSSPACQ